MIILIIILILLVSCLIDCVGKLRCINKKCDLEGDDGMNCNKIEGMINRLQNSFESMQYEMLQMKAQLANMNYNYQSESDTTY